jgi:cyclophilin family peptidyl-prolyl cis-trans isomerase
MEELRRTQKRKSQRKRIIVAVVVAGGFLALILVFSLRGSSNKKTPAASTSTTTKATATTVSGSTTKTASEVVTGPTAPATVGCPDLNGSSPHYEKFTKAPPTCIDPTKTYTATIQTDVGTITVNLLPKQAPKTVNSFVFLAGYHYFDGIVFHRVVTNFVDQTGDPTATGSGGPGYQFADELPKSVSDYKAGTLAMANSGPNTNGSQFFIVDSAAGGKDLTTPAYSLFGRVTAGLSVVQKINADGSSSSTGTPKVVHRMIKVTITES